MTDWYEPGFKAGGPIRSCVNFAQHMKNNYEVRVFTSDRDLGGKEAYPTVQTDKWLVLDGVFIFYGSPQQLSWKAILNQIKTLRPDYIYLNSFFSRYFAVYPLLMKRIGSIKAPIILAPRGMLKKTALQFKPGKKKIFLWLFKAFRFPALIQFHATDTTEAEDITRYFGNAAAVTLISNFPGVQKIFVEPRVKEIGSLKMIFIGRIHPIKNLYFLLESLQKVTANIQLTIAGILEDQQYWQRCNELIESLPTNIAVSFLGDVQHSALENLLYEHHVFVLPTQGENFGHAIFEALSAGRPALISNETPWKNLAIRNAGWDLSLSDVTVFTNTIERAAAMTREELIVWCKGAWQLCYDFINNSSLKERYINLFN
jgi:glycosyltransferase involved in cell wall biosynthesis